MTRLTLLWFWFLRVSGLGAALYLLLEERDRAKTAATVAPRDAARSSPDQKRQRRAWECLTAIEHRFVTHSDSLQTPDGCLWTKVGSSYVRQQ